MKTHSGRTNGFTLMELMIALALVGIILAGMGGIFLTSQNFLTRAMSGLGGASSNAQDINLDLAAKHVSQRTARANMLNLSDSNRQLKLRMDYNPDTLAAIGSAANYADDKWVLYRLVPQTAPGDTTKYHLLWRTEAANAGSPGTLPADILTSNDAAGLPNGSPELVPGLIFTTDATFAYSGSEIKGPPASAFNLVKTSLVASVGNPAKLKQVLAHTAAREVTL